MPTERRHVLRQQTLASREKPRWTTPAAGRTLVGELGRRQPMSANQRWTVVLVCSALTAGCAQQQAPPPPPVASAPGPYDGTWVVQAAPAGTGSESISDMAACDGVQIRIDVKNNQVEGMLARSAYGGGVRQ